MEGDSWEGRSGDAQAARLQWAYYTLYSVWAQTTYAMALSMGVGQPLPNATITKVVPFMPDHGHGTEEVPEMSATDAEGYVDVTNIDFMMPGVWRLEFHVDVEGTVDTARFGVCIDG